MEVAFPGRMGKPNSASCQQPQGSAGGGMSVFMQGDPTLGYQSRVPADSQLKSGSCLRGSLNRQKGATICCAMTPAAGQT